MHCQLAGVPDLATMVSILKAGCRFLGLELSKCCVKSIQGSDAC